MKKKVSIYPSISKKGNVIIVKVCPASEQDLLDSCNDINFMIDSLNIQMHW